MVYYIVSKVWLLVTVSSVNGEIAFLTMGGVFHVGMVHYW